MKVSTTLQANLRERADDHNALTHALARAHSNITLLHNLTERSTTQDAMLARDLTTYGDLLRIQGDDLAQSIRSLQEAITLWTTLGKDKALLMAKRKLALALLYNHQPHDALSLLDSLLQHTQTSPALAVYAPFLHAERALVHNDLKHTAKALHDLDQAIAYFRAKKIHTHADMWSKVRASLCAHPSK